MNILDFLALLQRQNITLSVEGDRLHYTAPPEVITDELQNNLVSYQSEILALLHWKERLQGMTPLELPADYPRSGTQTYRGQCHVL